MKTLALLSICPTPHQVKRIDRSQSWIRSFLDVVGCKRLLALWLELLASPQ